MLFWGPRPVWIGERVTAERPKLRDDLVAVGSEERLEYLTDALLRFAVRRTGCREGSLEDFTYALSRSGPCRFGGVSTSPHKEIHQQTFGCAAVQGFLDQMPVFDVEIHGRLSHRLADDRDCIDWIRRSRCRPSCRDRQEDQLHQCGSFATKPPLDSVKVSLSSGIGIPLSDAAIVLQRQLLVETNPLPVQSSRSDNRLVKRARRFIGEFGLAEDEVPVMLLSVGPEHPGNWAQKPRLPVADVLELV